MKRILLPAGLAGAVVLVIALAVPCRADTVEQHQEATDCADKQAQITTAQGGLGREEPDREDCVQGTGRPSGNPGEPYYLHFTLKHEIAAAEYRGNFTLDPGDTPRGQGLLTITVKGKCVESTTVEEFTIGGFAKAGKLHLRLNQGRQVSDQTRLDTENLECMWLALKETGSSLQSVLARALWEDVGFDLPINGAQAVKDNDGHYRYELGPR